MAETLKMKVDLSDFMTAQGTLQTQIGKLQSLLERYASVKKRANEFIEDDDSRYAKLQEVIDQEIKKVRAQLKVVEKIKRQIDEVVKAMDSLENKSNQVIEEGKSTVKNGLESIIDLSDLDL